MVEKPIEWRRFERVELEGQVAHAASSGTVVSQPSSPPSLLHEFERVLRENERLHLEIATLRAEAARNGSGTSKYREELESARIELDRIEGDSDAQPVNQPGPAPVSAVKNNRDVAENSQTVAQPSIATVIAGYIFANPTDQNIRLVQDALRARGLGEVPRQT